MSLCFCRTLYCTFQRRTLYCTLWVLEGLSSFKQLDEQSLYEYCCRLLFNPLIVCTYTYYIFSFPFINPGEKVINQLKIDKEQFLEGVALGSVHGQERGFNCNQQKVVAPRSCKSVPRFPQTDVAHPKCCLETLHVGCGWSWFITQMSYLLSSFFSQALFFLVVQI